MKKKVNWGILGLGKIAHKFAADLQLVEGSTIYGVASRNRVKARTFSEEFSSVTYYDSYEALAKDPDIGVVYIATPHTFHFENTLMCLQNGKSVLCEKPMGMNEGEVTRLIDEAKTRNLFLMEGIWTRFIPAIEKLIDLLEQNRIGDIFAVRADFGFKPVPNPKSRLFDKSLGAGSLLDIGIYPIYLSLLTLGLPKQIKATARFTETGADSYCAMLFDYANDSKAILESTIEANTPTEAIIYGSNGSIKLHSNFHHTERLTITSGETTETIEIAYTGNGYVHEIEEVNTCIIRQVTESKKLPHKTSLKLIEILDSVRQEIGLSYD